MKTEKEPKASDKAIDYPEALSTARASPAAITGAMGVALPIKLARLTPPQEIANHERLLARLLAA